MGTCLLQLATCILLLTESSSGSYILQGSNYDEYPKTPSINDLSGPELASLMTVNTRVVRGKDWKWGDQDGGYGGKGTIIQGILDGWVRVEWDAGETNSYRIGHDGKYDLYFAASETYPTATAIVAETTENDQQNKEYETPSSEEEISISTTPRYHRSGPLLAALMTAGTRVVRGKDWEWFNQDGGAGNRGTIIRGVVKGWVRVEWDSGETNSYRMGNEEKYDLDLADSPAATTTSTAETDKATLRTSLSGPELAASMTVGTRVVRGKDWIWGDQDGGAGNKGTIIREVVIGWVRVEWDSGETNSYRMGNEEKYDLDLADSPAATTTSTTETDSATSRTLLSGPELAARMTVGTRVVRGKDWMWDDQDGGAGNEGTVDGEVVDGWVPVAWDYEIDNFHYRMGDEDKYDLDLADSSTATSSTTEKYTADPTSRAPLSGPELAALMTVGARVVRGRDWKWDNQDGGPGGKGTVTDTGVYTDWVNVRWDTGDSYNYRMGDRGHYDLILADTSVILSDVTTKPKAETSTVTEVTVSSGPELAVSIKVGDRVIRGRDWDWGDQDGGAGGEGTVTNRVWGKWFSVRWDTGDTYNYRMGVYGKYDLSLVESTSPPSERDITTAIPEVTGQIRSTTTEETTPTLTTTTTEEMLSMSSAMTTDNIQKSNSLFAQLVEKEISSVPQKNRIQTMQDILEVLKKYSRWH